MKTINIKEARSQFSSLLERVANGEDIEITKHGKPIARLTAPQLVHPPMPNLAEFRSSINIQGKSLSQTILIARDEERF